MAGEADYRPPQRQNAIMPDAGEKHAVHALRSALVQLASKEAHKGAPAKEESFEDEDSDDDMPPQRQLGVLPEQNDRLQESFEDEDSDDDMPPQRQLGVLPEQNDSLQESFEDEDSDDDMPPQRQLGVLPEQNDSLQAEAMLSARWETDSYTPPERQNGFFLTTEESD
eukprot:TRINITY_DN15328_c0_g1_i1.p1 TRINITY_DN15328_c0_g1~~TRINITY_DN15328_c0_g1_i1.p1  ORF type:complete len:181 (+),score=52.00 TRINITY_DN15328_c0_g1_i1:42-545(+)